MENEKYVVYQYLKFIWNKKWFLVGATILFMLLGYLYSQMTPVTYTGTALVFTGNAKNDEWSKPELIKFNLQDINSSVQARIPGNFQVTLSVTEKSLSKAESEIQEVANAYLDKLQERYKSQHDTRESHVKALEQMISQLKKENDEYLQLIKEIDDEQKVAFYSEAHLQNVKALPDYEEKLSKEKLQLVLMEEPDLKNITAVQASNNSLRNMVLGGALGFQLMLLLLVIWKYILDARRSLSS